MKSATEQTELVLTEIGHERFHQRSIGYTHGNDDKYGDFELAYSGAAYAMAVINPDLVKPLWPFPHVMGPETYELTRRESLIKAAALIVAQIEALDRAEKIKDA